MAENKVLLTGAAGFVGQSVARALVHLGYSVVGLVRPGSKAPMQPGVVYRNLDLVSLAGWAGLPRDVTAVVHCAARIPEHHGHQTLDQAEILWRVNVQGTHGLLDWARSNGIRCFVFCSTHSVYARPLPVPVPETHQTYPTGRATLYALSKLAGEILVTSTNSSEMQTGSLRLSSVYGPNMSASGVVVRFITQAAHKQPIVLSAHPDTQLDLVHVADVASAVVQALTNKLHHSVYNLGGGHGTTLMTLAEAAVAVFSPSEPVRIEFERDYPPPVHSVLDISRAKSDLGYRPLHNIRSGLQTMGFHTQGI